MEIFKAITVCLKSIIWFRLIFGKTSWNQSSLLWLYWNYSTSSLQCCNFVDNVSILVWYYYLVISSDFPFRCEIKLQIQHTCAKSKCFCLHSTDSRFLTQHVQKQCFSSSQKPAFTSCLNECFHSFQLHKPLNLENDLAFFLSRDKRNPLTHQALD